MSLTSTKGSTDAETAAGDCADCGAHGTVRPVAARLTRCSLCAFVRPLPSQVGPDESLVLPAAWRGVAPDGVLRNKYRLLRSLGAGAHGETFLAEHLFLRHPCVVKILPLRATDAWDAGAARLRDEARSGYRVNHGNVVRVMDCDVADDLWYFVMEYVDGVSLAALIEANVKPAWPQALKIALDSAAGLGAVHRAGILHRDVKPANLLLGLDGIVRVADLGVANVASPGSFSSHETAPQAGTPMYAAPEAFAAGGQVDARADLYSLGATLFAVVSGRPPHRSGSLFEMLVRRQSAAPEWPADALPGAPEGLRTAILRLLEPDPGRRFATAAELSDFLSDPSGRSARRPRRDDQDLPPARGIGLLPLRNASGRDDHEWLGFALVDYIGQELSKTDGLYVADSSRLKSLVEQSAGVADAEVMLACGRKLGAGTIVEGSYQIEKNNVSVELWFHRTAAATPIALHASGSLSSLVELQNHALHLVRNQLGIESSPERVSAWSPNASAEAQAKMVRARQAYMRGDYASAIELANDALAEAPELAEAVGFLGVCCARLGRNADAEMYHRRQEAIAVRRGDARLMVEAHANLGVMYYFQGDYERAFEYYSQAAREADQLGFVVERAQIYSNLGFVLFRLGRQEEAEQAFRRAIETHRANGALVLLVGPYNGLGNVLVEQKRYNEADSFYRRALLIAQELGDRANVGTSHMHLGRCAALQGRFADAKQEFAMALSALEETTFWNGLARLDEYMAEMNLELGNFQEAARCAQQRIELARQNGNRRMESAAWEQKAAALERAGAEIEAAECREHARVLREESGTA